MPGINATCPIAEYPSPHAEIGNALILLVLCTKVPSEGHGKDLQREKHPQNPRASLEPTTVPGSLCLLIWDSWCFMFYYWWPKAKATNKCLCWQQGASFPGLHFKEESHVSRLILSVWCPFSPHAMPRSKQSQLLELKILF